MTAALNRYSWLTVDAAGDNSRLERRIDNQRREELAAFGATPQRQGIDIALHAVTLGKYSHRAKRDDDNIELLSVYRRAEYNLEFLDKLVAAGTPPEVAYQESQVRASVRALSALMPSVPSPQLRLHVQQTLRSLGKLSDDKDLRADCTRAAQAINRPGYSFHTVPGVVAEPAVLPMLKEFE